MRCLWLTITALKRTRYRGLIYELISEIEEVKPPAAAGGLDGCAES